MLKFPAEVLSESLENLLDDIKLHPNEALMMPTRLNYGGAYGSAIHALQVIATWSQCSTSQKIIILPITYSANREVRARFASTLPGMAGLYFSDVTRSAEEEVARYSSLELVAPRVTAMQERSFGNTVEGAAVALCCFAGAKNEYLNALYGEAKSGGVRDHSDFRLLISRILDQLGTRVANSIGPIQLNYLSGLIYQLFHNADEHGAYDLNGNRYGTSMRGITARLTVVEREGVQGADKPLQAYLTKLLLSDAALTGSDDKISLVEISVFDTGPGLALRWLSGEKNIKSYQDISLQEEEMAVQTCFEKHASTKASQYVGQGLSMALWAMKRLDAFMTLRTGRLSLYQDLTIRETIEFKPVNRYPGRELSPIAGTGYTIYFMVK